MPESPTLLTKDEAISNLKITLKNDILQNSIMRDFFNSMFITKGNAYQQPKAMVEGQIKEKQALLDYLERRK